jgi:hypothetical protein
MSERQHTIVCSFDTNSPRISALQIHDWIYESLKLPTDIVRMIQIDGPKSRVFIKLDKNEQALDLLQATGGQMEYTHENGESSTVHLELAGIGIRRIRVENLHPDIPDRLIRDKFAEYGEVKTITEEAWSKVYRYQVANGIRTATTCLKKHVPSHLVIGWNTVLNTYEGQPPTCYGCNAGNHLHSECPNRRQMQQRPRTLDRSTWAELLQQVPGEPRSADEGKMETSPPVQNGSSSIYRESLTQSSEKAQSMEEHFDTGLVTAEALISDRIERDEQTQWNPKKQEFR